MAFPDTYLEPPDTGGFLLFSASKQIEGVADELKLTIGE